MATALQRLRTGHDPHRDGTRPEVQGAPLDRRPTLLACDKVETPLASTTPTVPGQPASHAKSQVGLGLMLINGIERCDASDCDSATPLLRMSDRKAVETETRAPSENQPDLDLQPTGRLRVQKNDKKPFAAICDQDANIKQGTVVANIHPENKKPCVYLSKSSPF